MNRIITMCLVLGVWAISIAAQNTFTIQARDDGSPVSDSGGWWYTYNDSQTGGNSVVFPSTGKFIMSKPGFGDKGYAAFMKGTVGNKLGWDYIGMGVNLSRTTQCPFVKPVDLREFTKLQFKLKGTVSGGRLVINMPFTENKCESGANSPSTLTEWADYEAAITGKVKPDWTTVILDLRKDFHQPKWAKQNAVIPIDKLLENAKNLNFHFSSPDGDSIEIWVDDLMFVK